MSEADSRSRMLPTDRIVYSAIADRPPLRLPNGARMVVWVIVNVEEWDPTQTMPRTVLTPPAGGSPMPDIPNWAWHEYGNRVGFWRMLKVFDEFRFPAVLAINGSAHAAYEPIVAARRSTGAGSSWVTASPSATCRRSRTSAPTSARPPTSSRRLPARRRADGLGRA